MKKKLKLSIIGGVGVPARYGGWETLIDNLIDYIGDKFEITIFCSSKIYKKKIKTYKNCNLVYVNLHPNGYQSIFYDALSLYKSNKFANVTLILGISGAIFFPLIKSKKNKIIVNFDGIEWKRSKWGFFTKIFLRLSEIIAINFSNHIITDNKGIFNYVLKTYNREAIQITYGGDHVKKIRLKKKLAEIFNIPKSYAFSVCRIEPENNIEMILNCFSKLKLNLVIVGNWNASEYGKNLNKYFKVFNNINMLDSIYDQLVLDQIRSNAFIYIHGHSVGGTNPSLVEAMSLGLPILAYDINFNRFTTDNSCLYFKNEKQLYSLIIKLNTNLISKIAARMRKIANFKFKWKKIAKQYSTLIEEL
jgi:glycosyltransferase involved in cell wall biosynthesis